MNQYDMILFDMIRYCKFMSINIYIYDQLICIDLQTYSITHRTVSSEAVSNVFVIAEVAVPRC